MKCPDVPMPERIARLERDSRGYPIFYAIQQDDGGHSFKGVVQDRMIECAQHKLCGICGQKLDYWIAFAGGPLSVKNRAFTEPPMHKECLEYAAQVCPYILRGGWDRSRTERAEQAKTDDPDGTMAPSDTYLFLTRGFDVRLNSTGRYLIFRPRPAKDIRKLTPDMIEVIDEARLESVSPSTDGGATGAFTVLASHEAPVSR